MLKMGMGKVGQISGKADPDIQQEYKEKTLEPRLLEASEGKRVVFFVDAAHYGRISRIFMMF